MEDIDKIELYLNGTMPEPERIAFEAEIESNPALAEELDALRLAKEAVELSIGDSLRDQLQQWQEAEASGTKSEEATVVKMAPRRSLRRVLALAASVLLLLAVGSFWYANDRYDANELAMGFYENTTFGPNRSIGSSSHPLAEGIEAVQSGDYATAKTYFQNVDSDDESYFDARYFLAHSLYRQEQSEEAINALQELRGISNISLKEKAEWLTVLCYLQAKQSGDEDFQTLMEEMTTNSDHEFHPQSVELNHKLNSFWYTIAN